MSFLKELAGLMTEPQRSEFLATIEKMGPEELEATEREAKRYYLHARAGKDAANIRRVIRHNYADNRVNGAAAERRRKQMERKRPLSF